MMDLMFKTAISGELPEEVYEPDISVAVLADFFIPLPKS